MKATTDELETLKALLRESDEALDELAKLQAMLDEQALQSSEETP